MAPNVKSTSIICLTGPESTGKSTLAIALAEHLEATLVTEYARDYLQNRVDTDMDSQGRYDALDLKKIARRQLLLEEQALRKAPGILILDTDILVIAIWWDIRFKQRPEWLVEAMDARSPRGYLLLYPDLPWEADTLRESADQRMMLYARYLDELQHSNFDYRVIRGQGEERFSSCLSACRETINSF